MAAVKVKSGSLEALSLEDKKVIERSSIEEAVRKALAAKLAETPDHLVVRDILPDLDLLDGNGSTISKREWVQPVSGSYGTSNDNVTIYKTGANSNYDKKVIVIYGVKQVGTSVNKTSGSLSAASITFEKGNSKTISIIDLQRLETEPELELYFQNPVIYGVNETASIKFYAKDAASGGSDNIMLLAKVVEPLGENVNG